MHMIKLLKLLSNEKGLIILKKTTLICFFLVTTMLFVACKSSYANDIKINNVEESKSNDVNAYIVYEKEHTSYFDNLFQQERNLDGTWGNIKNLPEDLCFFTGNKLLLGTVSHEDICYVYPPTKEIASQFIKLGNWEEKNYLPDEHIHIEI
ncbi:hypothetical protein SAMN02746066_03720 [Anaerosporobacter mobilis DSM 15930]|uniref:Uncharacterized protein n=1 Tax=Anaerosporobacter mobilis DSM 15930 TaxID=1120996 RepID=A0A1M7MBA3_9FIRM|nr:hypothetical protein SAMN02746066_03720 [Anaerosporobacter mobilis DSM 15930]